MARELPAGVCANHRIHAKIRGTEHHVRPHFHVIAPDWDCSVDIETGEIIEGEDYPSPTEKNEIEAYRLRHLDLLRTKWREKHGPED